jgi:hypothetical protein
MAPDTEQPSSGAVRTVKAVADVKETEEDEVYSYAAEDEEPLFDVEPPEDEALPDADDEQEGEDDWEEDDDWGPVEENDEDAQIDDVDGKKSEQNEVEREDGGKARSRKTGGKQHRKPAAPRRGPWKAESA